MPYIAIPNADLFYEEFGAGDPVLFLHSSFSRGLLAFHAQYPALQAQYRCLLPDFRGHGRSRSARQEWHFTDLIDDLPHVMDGLGLPRAHVIGYSLGGDVAMRAASRWPERFRSLVTIGASAKQTASGVALADDMEPEVLEQKGQHGFIAQLTANHREAHGGDWRHFVRQTLASWRSPKEMTPAELQRITAPALFVAGETDPFVGEAELRFMTEHAAGSRYEIIDGCGHRPHMVGHKPDLVNELILSFLRSVQ